MKKSSKLTTKQRYILQIIFGVILLFLVGGIGWGLHYVSHLPDQQITQVTVTGGDTIDPGTLKALVWEELEGEYVSLVPRTNKYLYPESSIYTKLSNYPRVKSVEVVRENQTVSVEFTEYEPYALWCDNEQSRCLLIDREGYSFAEAPQLSGGLFYRFVVEDAVLLERTEVLSKELLERTVAFASLLKDQFGFEVGVINHTTGDDVFYGLQSGPELRTTLRMDDTETLENLRSILDSEEFSHLTTDNFQYLDLRFGNKVYVNEEIAAPVTSTSTATTSEEQSEGNNSTLLD